MGGGGGPRWGGGGSGRGEPAVTAMELSMTACVNCVPHMLANTCMQSFCMNCINQHIVVKKEPMLVPIKQAIIEWRALHTDYILCHFARHTHAAGHTVPGTHTLLMPSHCRRQRRLPGQLKVCMPARCSAWLSLLVLAPAGCTEPVIAATRYTRRVQALLLWLGSACIK